MAHRTTLLRSLLPPLAMRWLRRWRGQTSRFNGNFATWAEAQRASTGYDSALILERVLAATREVRAGRAAFERDSVRFEQSETNHPLLAGLLYVAARNGGKLAVADFGGSLGSVYWQHRRWFDTLEAVRWSVVEQPHFVAAGRQELADARLGFYATLAECVAQERPTVLLLSSVLSYLEAPQALLDEAIRTKFSYILIDRTPCLEGAPDRLTVQQVPPAIYPASYPCWLFARSSLLQPLARDYRQVDEWLCPDEADDIVFRGFLFERVTP
jgi:putative methyltransferase (TIGR04325 family)